MAEKRRDFVEVAKEFTQLLKRVYELNEVLGEALVKALKNVLPDIRHSVGWMEAGVECIALFSQTGQRADFFDPDVVSLHSIIEEELVKPLSSQGIELTIDTPFGIYIRKDKAEKVRENLRKLLNREAN